MIRSCSRSRPICPDWLRTHEVINATGAVSKAFFQYGPRERALYGAGGGAAASKSASQAADLSPSGVLVGTCATLPASSLAPTAPTVRYPASLLGFGYTLPSPKYPVVAGPAPVPKQRSHVVLATSAQSVTLCNAAQGSVAAAAPPRPLDQLLAAAGGVCDYGNSCLHPAALRSVSAKALRMLACGHVYHVGCRERHVTASSPQCSRCATGLIALESELATRAEQLQRPVGGAASANSKKSTRDGESEASAAERRTEKARARASLVPPEDSVNQILLNVESARSGDLAYCAPEDPLAAFTNKFFNLTPPVDPAAPVPKLPAAASAAPAARVPVGRVGERAAPSVSQQWADLQNAHALPPRSARLQMRKQ